MSNDAFSEEMLQVLGFSRPDKIRSLDISISAGEPVLLKAELYVTQEQMDTVNEMLIKDRAKNAQREEEKVYIVEIARLLRESCEPVAA